MRTKTVKLKKSLSNLPHIKVLETVGLSDKPISAGKIEKETASKGNRNSDVYRIISDLCGTYSRKIHVASWKEICSKSNEEGFKLYFIKKLRKIFEPYLRFSKGADKEIEGKKEHAIVFDSWNNIEFKISADVDHETYCLDIFNSDSVFKLRIQKQKKENERDIDKMTKDNVQLSFDFDSKKKRGKGRLKTWSAVLGIPLYVKYDEKNKDFDIYVNESDIRIGRNINRIQFLKVAGSEAINYNVINISKPTLDKSNVKVMKDIFGKGRGEFNRHLKVTYSKDIRRSERYFLSFSGFLLYLLDINSVKRNKSEDTEYKGKNSYQTNTKINKMIDALTRNEYTRKDYPFLWNYHVLDKVAGRNFKVELLKRIAFESQHLVTRENDNFLKYWVASQFHSTIAKLFGGPPFFSPAINLSLNHKIKVDVVIKWIKEYDKKMLEYSLRYLQKEVTDLTDLLQTKK